MKKYIALFLILLAALPLVQCSKRSNPVDVAKPQGGFFTSNYYSTNVGNDYMNDPPYRNILIYLPPGYDTSGATRYPVLYLLHGYGGDDTYYKGLYSVGNILDDMINSGEIQPMIVVTPDASNQFGGSFYTNSPEVGGRSFAGNMESFVTTDVVDYVDSTYYTLADRHHRGISGHSMGGYGAVKLAMLHNNLFGSASSMSGPLAFWGGMPYDSSFTGLFELINYVFAENGGAPNDTLDTFHRITPGPGKRLTNMMFAMASAFSPHDPANPDHTYAHFYRTIMSTGYVDLPFDSSGAPVIAVWQNWMANDVAAIAASGLAGVFAPDSTPLYIDAGDRDDLGFQFQAQAFDSLLTLSGISHTFAIYSGGGGPYIADHTMLIATRIREVLKFHNEVFKR